MSDTKSTKENLEVKNKSSSSKMDKLIYFANFVAIIIVGFSILMLLLIIGRAIWTSTENEAPKKIDISYTLQVDSNQLKSYKDSLSLEFNELIRQNNQKVIVEVDNSIKQQYQRMESILSVQEDKSKLFAYVAGFMAILVALATFFGFKSINEMKKATIEVAEYEAVKIAEKKAKEVAENEAKSEINIQMRQIKIDLESTLKTLLTDENKKEVENTFKTKTEEIDQLKDTLNNLMAKAVVILEEIKITEIKRNTDVNDEDQVDLTSLQNSENGIDKNDEIKFN